MTATPVATDRPYQLLPPLDADQRELLRQSIEQNGVLEPVVFDEAGEILDGHHRVEIAEELGIEYPRRVLDHLDEVGKQQYALTVNLARRQLTSATRSAHIMRLRQLGMSIRQIASATGISRGTVANDLAQVSNSGHLPETITGADGKSYASSRPAPKPEPATDPEPQTPEPAAAPTAPAGSGSTSPEPEPKEPVAVPTQTADPASAVAAALNQHVPDPGASARAWRKDLHERMKPIDKLTLWLDVDAAAKFADDSDVETLRLLAVSFAEKHRRIVAARTAPVTQLRRVK
jgi:hypothetical protein